MFTGLVAGQGELVSLVKSGNEAKVEIRPLFAIPGPQNGESIAVNGVCLTVEGWKQGLFSAYISGESLRATALGNLKPGVKVNLERALAMGDRFGGHMVSGHVDGKATVVRVEKKGLSHLFRLEFDPAISNQVIPKGSVALDGISLTVNQCGPGFLEVNVIPETLGVTTIGAWKPGHQVNLETDLIGKYILRIMEPYLDGSAFPSSPVGGSGLTMDFLRENGF